MAFQFKIQIKNISKPPVWRRLLVPESITFERFHQIIQSAFGWRSIHLYRFSQSTYGSDEIVGYFDEEYVEPFQRYATRAASEVRLPEIFGSVGQKYLYIYDYGDDWVHQITLETIAEESIITPTLLAGKGACPPEDCGGPWGYANLRDIMRDKKHPEYKETKQWLGLKARQEWDADDVDMEFLKMIVRQS
jgi:hypothetical protein